MADQSPAGSRALLPLAALSQMHILTAGTEARVAEQETSRQTCLLAGSQVPSS